MEQAIGYLIGLGPYYLGAIVLGGGLAAFMPWLLKQPQRWLFTAIVFLSLVAIGSSDAGSEGSFLKQLTWGSLFAYCGIWLIATTRDWPALFLNLPVGLLILICFIAISIFWSPFPIVSIRRFVQLIGVLLIGLMVAQQAVEGRGLMEQLMFPASVFLILGLVQALVFPGSAFDADRSLGALGTHKNTWGQFSLICCLVFAVTLATQRHLRWRASGLLSLAVVSVLASKSTTSLLALGVLVSVVLCWLAINRGGRLGILALVIAVTSIVFATHVYLVLTGKFPLDLMVDSLFNVTGKNSTLTGRAQLWELMYKEIARHPFLGLGYGGFWMGLDGDSRAVIDRLDWGPPTQAHSGYIDVLNEIGILGMLVLVLALVNHLFNIWLIYRTGAKETALFHGALLLCVLIINYSETTFLRTTHLWWVVLCVSIIEVQARHQLASARNALKRAQGSTRE